MFSLELIKGSILEMVHITGVMNDIIAEIESREQADAAGSYGEVFYASPALVLKRTSILDSSKDITFPNIRELCFLQQFRHPNIVDLKYQTIRGGKILMVLERGVTLDQAWNDYKLSERIRLAPKIIFDIVSALVYLEGHRISYHDVKPNNIVIGADFTAKLIDFGAVQFFGNGQSESLTTKRYREPEAFRCVFGSGGAVFGLSVTVLDWLRGKMVGQRDWKDADIPDLMEGPDPYLELLTEHLSMRSHSLLEVLKLMSRLDYRKRISITDLYNHKLFDQFRKESTETPAPQKHEIDSESVKSIQCPQNRSMVVKWMIKQICHSWGVTCLSLATSIFDRYVVAAKITDKQLTVAACAAMILSFALLDMKPNISHIKGKDAIDTELKKKKVRSHCQRAVILLNGDLWRICFDHDIEGVPDWDAVTDVCLDVDSFSSYDKAVDKYKRSQIKD